MFHFVEAVNTKPPYDSGLHTAIFVGDRNVYFFLLGEHGELRRPCSLLPGRTLLGLLIVVVAVIRSNRLPKCL